MATACIQGDPTQHLSASCLRSALRCRQVVTGRREAPVVAEVHQPATCEGQAGPTGVAERPVVPMKPGNAGGGKGP